MNRELQDLRQRLERLENVEEHRRAAEKAWRESELRYRQIIDSANDAIFIAEVETGILIDANPRAEVLMGRPREEIIGMNQKDLHPIEEAPEYRQLFKDYVARGQGTTGVLKVRHSSGREIPVEISTSVFEVGGRRYIQGIFRDVTERFEAEKEQQELRQRLEDAMSKLLARFLPICAGCKKIRDHDDQWQRIEAYIEAHTGTQFSHGLCPECLTTLYPSP